MIDSQWTLWIQSLWPRRFALALSNQFPGFGYEIVRNIHHRFGWLNTSLILYQSVILGLFLVMGKYSADFVFFPSGWKLRCHSNSGPLLLPPRHHSYPMRLRNGSRGQCVGHNFGLLLLVALAGAGRRAGAFGAAHVA
jgi:hypothetical protein